MSTDDPHGLDAALQQRLGRPQRHRLLQGYPALPQMRPASPRSVPALDGADVLRECVEGVRSLRGALTTTPSAIADALDASRAALAHLREEDARPEPGGAFAVRRRAWREERRAQLEARIDQLTPLVGSSSAPEPPFVDVDRRRDLIVGVIPHTQCTPRVAGCGFCTFPHEAPDKRSRRSVVQAVDEELVSILEREPDVAGRTVSALYFGGGTANLTAPEQIAALCASIGRHLRLGEAEVSLEGVPVLFTSWFHAPLKMLEALPVRQRRISMGIQTFDRAWLERMGRSSFGDERSIGKLIARCRSMGITTSGDFLFNLPGQPLASMIDDLDRAIAVGLDQICLYNLVLYEGLGTPWSEDPALVAAMPDPETACAHWLALRERALAAGFVQTTLTNFERREVAGGDRAFVYERASFSPEKTDAIGFGPMSLSMFVDAARRRAVKLLRRKDLRPTPWSGDDLYFPCEGDDLRLLFVTRSLAKTRFDKEIYSSFCGSSVEQDFPGALAVLGRNGLVEVDEDAVSLTPRGMFFSDAVVSTFIAEKRAPRGGAGVHTGIALAEPTRHRPSDDYDGMG